MRRRRYLSHKEAARTLVHARLLHFQALYATLGHQLIYKRVAVRDQRSRWGSASKAGNLNFNYRIVHLRPALQDYIIVHELCHLKEFNHAEPFWNLVALTTPDWNILRAELRKVPVH